MSTGRTHFGHVVLVLALESSIFDVGLLKGERRSTFLRQIIDQLAMHTTQATVMDGCGVVFGEVSTFGPVRECFIYK